MLFEPAGQFILDKIDKELPAIFCYHNLAHTRDVCAAAIRLGRSEHISDQEMRLLLIAACYHDSGFLRISIGHETESCNIARENLPRFGYNATEIELICGMIMATHIPQSPNTELEQILADADLDYLGRDDFFEIGGKIFHERGLTDWNEWNMIQLKFLEEHKYFTQTALNLRGPKKLENIEKVRALLQ
jgi:HD superfamily phosphodiesterase